MWSTLRCWGTHFSPGSGGKEPLGFMNKQPKPCPVNIPNHPNFLPSLMNQPYKTVALILLTSPKV